MLACRPPSSSSCPRRPRRCPKSTKSSLKRSSSPTMRPSPAPTTTTAFSRKLATSPPSSGSSPISPRCVSASKLAEKIYTKALCWHTDQLCVQYHGSLLEYCHHLQYSPARRRTLLRRVVLDSGCHYVLHTWCQHCRNRQCIPHLRWLVSCSTRSVKILGLVTMVRHRYTASAQLCPKKHRAIVGWVVGWLNILGEFTTLCVHCDIPSPIL